MHWWRHLTLKMFIQGQEICTRKSSYVCLLTPQVCLFFLALLGAEIAGGILCPPPSRARNSQTLCSDRVKIYSIKSYDTRGYYKRLKPACSFQWHNADCRKIKQTTSCTISALPEPRTRKTHHRLSLTKQTSPLWRTLLNWCRVSMMQALLTQCLHRACTSWATCLCNATQDIVSDEALPHSRSTS